MFLKRMNASDNLERDDVLGDAYEYLIKQFADEGGKRGGEFYTPQHVVRTMVKILKQRWEIEYTTPQ